MLRGNKLRDLAPSGGRYVRAAGRALGKDRVEAQRGKDTVNFFAWAEGYVSQLNPLHLAARNSDLLEERHLWDPDHDHQKGLARLAGFEGQKAWKILDPIDEGNTDDGDDD